jgi:hypothetical protein
MASLLILVNKESGNGERRGHDVYHVKEITLFDSEWTWPLLEAPELDSVVYVELSMCVQCL